MLFLLPPSESKTPGGQALPLAQVSLSFGVLDQTREEVMRAFGNYDELMNAPTMPAVDRFNGTLYDAIHGRGLKGTPTEHNRITDAMFQRAKSGLLIQTAMFGLIGATDLIPNYKLSAGSGKLKKLWQAAHESVWARFEDQTIIDLRSKAYAELAPIPSHISHYWVDVLDASSGKALNHFNKKGKGLLVAEFLKGDGSIEKLALQANLRAEVEPRLIRLYV